MVGPWFTTPWRLVSQSHGAVVWRCLPPICPALLCPPPCYFLFPVVASRYRPHPGVPSGIPCLYPTGPPATHWRGPTPLSGDRFALVARVAPIPSTIPWPVPSSPCYSPLPGPIPVSHSASRVYTPPGRQQPFGAGPLSHPGTVSRSWHGSLLPHPLVPGQ